MANYNGIALSPSDKKLCSTSAILSKRRRDEFEDLLGSQAGDIDFPLHSNHCENVSVTPEDFKDIFHQLDTKVDNIEETMDKDSSQLFPSNESHPLRRSNRCIFDETINSIKTPHTERKVVRFVYRGDDVSDSSQLSTLASASISTFESAEIFHIKELLGIKGSIKLKFNEGINKHLSSLATEGEDQVQDKLRRHWMENKRYSKSFLIDTHASNHNIPIFKYSQSDESDHPSTAKPDFMSAIAPMVLKLKSLKGADSKEEKTFEVLFQAIERVHLFGRMNERLHTVVAFATTGETSWIFILKRIFEREKIIETYHLYPIAIDTIVPIWDAFNVQAAKDTAVYMEKDMYSLASIIATLGYHPGYCGIQRLVYSSSKIFSITPARKDSNGQLSIPHPKTDNSFVIKLSEGAGVTRAEQEITVLKHLKGQECVGYVIGTVQPELTSDPITLFSLSEFLPNHLNFSKGLRVDTKLSSAARFKAVTEFKNDLKGNSSPNCDTDLCWWNFVTLKAPEEYRAIVMHRAVDEKLYNSAEALEDFQSCQEEFADKGVLHCDIRRSNLLQFNFNPRRMYFIIDFDLARVLKKEEGEKSVTLELAREGGQREAIEATYKLKPDRKGWAIDEHTNKTEWDCKKDRSMLLIACCSLPRSPLTFTSPPQMKESVSLVLSFSGSSTLKEGK